MGHNCAPLVANLFLFCYDKDSIMSLSDNRQADIINGYLDDTLSIDNIYVDNMISLMYPSELQRNKANTADTEALFKDPFLMILFLPKCMISVTILILKLSISHFRWW